MTSLGLDTPQPMRCSTLYRLESPAIYRAVMALREQRFRVYRQGKTHHKVNGAILTDRELLIAAGEAQK